MSAPKTAAMEKSRKMSQASVVMAMKADMNLIIHAMRSNGSCIQHIKKTLCDLGYILPDGSVKTAESVATVAPKERGAAKKKDIYNLQDPLPFNSSAAADVDFLQFLLRHVERVTFSPAAMKGLLKGSQRRIPKHMLMEIWEFLFDDDGDEEWQFDNIQGVIEHLTAKNLANNRRGAELEFPIDWSAQGIYRVGLQSSRLVLVNQHTQQAAALSNAEFVEDPIDLSSIIVSKNFSLRRACVMKKGRVLMLPCVQLLPMHAPGASATSSAGKRGLKRPLPLGDSMPIAALGNGQPSLGDGSVEAAPAVLEAAGSGQPPSASVLALAVGKGSATAAATPEPQPVETDIQHDTNSGAEVFDEASFAPIVR